MGSIATSLSVPCPAGQFSILKEGNLHSSGSQGGVALIYGDHSRKASISIRINLRGPFEKASISLSINLRGLFEES